MDYKSELTFKEFIDKIKLIFKDSFRRWKFSSLMILPFFAFYLYKHYVHKITYTTEMKFVVEGGNSLASGVGGLLGQIGLRSGGSGAMNNFKILEFGKSKIILKKILFDSIDNKFIANYLIEKYNLDEEWSKSRKEFENFRFKHDNVDIFTSNELTAYNSLCSTLIKGNLKRNGLLTMSYNEDTGIFSINSETIDEELTLKIAKLNFEKLKYMFETELITNQTKTTRILKNKADSLQNLIQIKTSEIAHIQDRTQGLIQASPLIRKTSLEKEILGLVSAQAEFIKSYEMADIGLRDIRKSFIVIEEGNFPLEPLESSLIISLIKASVLGGFFVLLGITLINLYKGTF